MRLVGNADVIFAVVGASLWAARKRSGGAFFGPLFTRLKAFEQGRHRQGRRSEIGLRLPPAMIARERCVKSRTLRHRLNIGQSNLRSNNI